MREVRGAGLERTRRHYLDGRRVDLTLRPGVPRIVPGATLVRAVAAALTAAGAPAEASLGLILSDDAELAALNATHMGKEGPTDVLSFPLLPPEAFPDHPRGAAIPAGPGATGAAGAPPAAGFALPPGLRLHLGEIVVSVERAVEQAEEGRGGWTSDRRWTPAEELLLLVTHGTLHVCGWDHAEPVEEAAMRALEARLLGAGA